MRDLACSKERIEGQTQQPCTTLALRYGLYFPAHIRHARDLGYQRVLTTSGRPNPNPTGPLIHRLNARSKKKRLSLGVYLPDIQQHTLAPVV